MALWSAPRTKKPLILRGARQVGKTTIVRQFSNQFEQYIELNLELQEHQTLFESDLAFSEMVQRLFFSQNKSWSKKDKTLLFIDEIQESPKVIGFLRFFYELEPTISIIAAGSMLETLFDTTLSFPVGRVEYLVLRPLCFSEYLNAIGENEAVEVMQQIPLPKFAESKLETFFNNFALIGGMPEVVKQYASHRDLKQLSKIYNSLITSYMDDVEKYAHSSAQANYLRFIIKNMFANAGKRITFERFSNSNYKSRDMAEGLRTLEKAMLVNLVYPTTQTELPLLTDNRKSPKLQVLDSGLLNFFVGIQSEILGSTSIDTVYKGTLVEHLVGQEMLSNQFETLANLNFWVREKKGSMAEVDYIVNHNSKLIPIEVKSGKIGKLKSLMLYMEATPHQLAVRIYSGNLHIEKIKTPAGKSFYLLNLPLYLSRYFMEYLDWFENEVKLL